MTRERDDELDDFEGFDNPAVPHAGLAYITTIGIEEAARMGAIPEGIKLPADAKLYAVHLADGRTVAIMDNWASAYGAAVQNHLTPVSVH
jgi:hypothetical protein